MAGQFRFKNNSGTVVAQISASNAGAISFSGSAVDFSSVTTLTLGTTTLSGTASLATAAVSSSYSATATSSSYALTSTSASYALTSTSASYGLNALTSSNAMTASSADTLYVRNNVTALGSITAQTLIVQTVTSSVLFTTGSNKIGSSLSNTQELTGSVGITGSLTVVTNGTEFQVSAGGVNIGNALTDNHVVSGSVVINPNGLFVSSSGNVGIGSTSPAFKLETLGTGVIVAGFGRSDYGATNVTLVGLSGYRDVYKSAIGVVRTGDYDVGDIIVCLNSAANSTVVSASDEKIRIKSNGNVGIGTTSPNSFGGGYRTLAVAGTGTEGGIIQSMVGSTSALYIGTNSSQCFFAEPRNVFMTFGTNDTERMRITSAGSVGIGTNAPDNRVHIVSSATNVAGLLVAGGSNIQGDSLSGQILLGNTAANRGQIAYGNLTGYVYIENTWNNNDGDIRFRTKTSGTAVDAVTIKGSGNVGIGTTSPSDKLAIFGANIGLDQNNGNAGVYSTDGYGSNIGGSIALGGYYNGSNYIGFGSIHGKKENGTIDNAAGYLAFVTRSNSTGSTEKMRITSDGNVQINNAGGLRLYTESNGAYWMLRTYNAVSNQLRFNYQGSDLASIATGTGNYTALSDVNKKKDFEQSQVGLNEVLGLKPTLYRMKTEGDTEDKHLGFIAQEVKEFIPQAYSETGEGDDKFIGLTEMPIIAALTKAIQELSAEITILKNK